MFGNTLYPYFKDNRTNYELAYKDVLKLYSFKWELQLIAFNINVNYNTFSFNCNQHAIKCLNTYSVCT